MTEERTENQAPGKSEAIRPTGATSPRRAPIIVALAIVTALAVGSILFMTIWRDGDGLITFTDPEGRYELDHPSSWHRISIGAAFQPTSESRASLYVTEIPLTDPKDFVLDTVIGDLEQSPRGAILEQGPTEVGGRPGYAAHIVDDNGNGPGLVEAYAIAVSDGSGGSYALTYVAPPDAFDAHFASAKAIMATFRIS